MQEFVFKKFVLLCLMILVVQDIEAKVNYCDENAEHLLCGIKCPKVRKGSNSCIDYQEVPLGATYKDDILEGLNELRRKVVTGEKRDHRNTKFRKGKNMMELQWDNLLECTSQVEADKCKADRSKKSERKIGEEFIGEVKDLLAISNLENIKNDYDFYLDTIFNYGSRKLTNEMIDKFDASKLTNERDSVENAAQLIYSSSYLVGCSFSSSFYKSQDRTLVAIVCHFGPECVKINDAVYDTNYVNENEICDSGNQPSSKVGLCKPQNGENYLPKLYPPGSETGPEPTEKTPPSTESETGPDPTEKTPPSTGANFKPFCCNVAIVLLVALLFLSW